MAPLITFLKVLFLNTILYENCRTDQIQDCRYTDFLITGATSSTIDRCGSGSQSLYLGPYGFKTTVTKTFTNLTPKSNLQLSVGIWKFDTWDGEGVQIWANDVLLGNIIIGHDDGTRLCRTNVDNDLLVHVTKQFQVQETSLTIKFVDDLNEPLNNESWGFRDLIIQIFIPCINLYSECNYQGNLYQICKGEQLQSSKNIPFEIKSIQLSPNTQIKLKSPHYFGGNQIEFTTSQPCLDSFKFPKYMKPN
ncbi:unnamed protein product [Paramecium sonneborni]|uniref:Uncharacterized protein n=1 Tax=Paramecium sonneborni TaxID=65129 RepID=A0A8S1LSL3_9CILI|nr:unnamed protein product [Paramecium sonneborni]